MILRTLAKLHRIDWQQLIAEYPKFEHLDRLVTVFVFVDLLPKMAYLTKAFILSPLWYVLETAAAVVVAVITVTIKFIGGFKA